MRLRDPDELSKWFLAAGRVGLAAHAPPPRAQCGFTLLELIAAIVVLGLMFAGFVTVFGTVMRQSVEPQLHLQALAVGESYLHEVTSRAYRDPDTGLVCGTPEAQRPLFDDVCDYAGLVGNGCVLVSSACPVLGSCPCDRAGRPVEGLRDFGVSVNVGPLTLSGVAGLGIRVEVTHPSFGGSGVALESFRADD